MLVSCFVGGGRLDLVGPRCLVIGDCFVLGRGKLGSGVVDLC